MKILNKREPKGPRRRPHFTGLGDATANTVAPEGGKTIEAGFWECTCGASGAADSLHDATNRADGHAAIHTAKGSAAVNITVRTKLTQHSKVVMSEDLRVKQEQEKRRSLPPLTIKGQDTILRAIFRPVGRARRLANATAIVLALMLGACSPRPEVRIGGVPTMPELQLPTITRLEVVQTADVIKLTPIREGCASTFTYEVLNYSNQIVVYIEEPCALLRVDRVNWTLLTNPDGVTYSTYQTVNDLIAGFSMPGKNGYLLKLDNFIATNPICFRAVTPRATHLIPMFNTPLSVCEAL